MEILDNRPKNYKAVMVSLAYKEVHIYKDKYLVDKIQCEDAVTGMKYGRFGREDSCLIMTTQGGGMIVKILKRTATMDESDGKGGPPDAQNKRLNVPKKTKLFVDQTLREREKATRKPVCTVLYEHVHVHIRKLFMILENTFTLLERTDQMCACYSDAPPVST